MSDGMVAVVLTVTMLAFARHLERAENARQQRGAREHEDNSGGLSGFIEWVEAKRKGRPPTNNT
jgi:hypothetical protein